MSDANFASLNPALLARKGGAKPAMRPQNAPLPKEFTEQAGQDKLEDLGWNDLGDEPRKDGADDNVVPLSNETSSEADAPTIKHQQAALAARVQSKGLKSKKAAAKITSSRRAAFTLRLDADRHLKLRLAATMRDVSAQVLVTEALDALLADIDDLDALAERMKRK